MRGRSNDLRSVKTDTPYSLYAEHATSDVGLAMNAVAASLGVDPSRVRAAVVFLESKGYLYSTIDDDHYKYTVYYPI